jgi:hypothetical protein
MAAWSFIVETQALAHLGLAWAALLHGECVPTEFEILNAGNAHHV